MIARFSSSIQQDLFNRVRIHLERLGYQNGLLVQDYSFRDCFATDNRERTAPLAAFGQTPPSYATACFSVLLHPGVGNASLVQDYRALGAPFAIEVRDDGVVHWIVGKSEATTRIHAQFSIDEIEDMFDRGSPEWQPAALLRAKNISFCRQPKQLTLFDDELLPELEHLIRNRLEPLMNAACAAAIEKYRETTGGRDPDKEQLFRLAFWMLAGKVFRDRQIDDFSDLSFESDPDDVLAAVTAHYDIREPFRFLNRATREIVLRNIWSPTFDFRNISPQVLTEVWSNIFVDEEVRKSLGIHSTPHCIAEYIVERLPIEDIPSDDRVVLEPCSGSGVFLVAAMQRLRDLLEPTIGMESRHDYLKGRLIGIEKEPIGVEISRLSLMLADFPNPNGWQLYPGDVFTDSDFPHRLGHSRIVLCNPPFESFSKSYRETIGADSTYKASEVLLRVIRNIHKDGMIGFVVPHSALDGDAYREARVRLTERFSNIELVSLPPSNTFESANHPAALLLAHGTQAGESVRITHRHVFPKDWKHFVRNFYISHEDTANKTVEEARKSLAVPLLNNVWQSLRNLESLGSVSEIHRGLEWLAKMRDDGTETGNRKKVISSTSRPGFREGIPPRARPLYSFVSPPTKFLDVNPYHLRRAKRLVMSGKLDRPKVILNAKRMSIGPWRLAAFADFHGLAYYQTFTAVYPYDPEMVIPITAILNGPMANAFLATHEIRDNTNDNIENIPIPGFTKSQRQKLKHLVSEYQLACGDGFFSDSSVSECDRLLREIDALVLEAYDLPPRFERQVLDFFGDSKRHVPFVFQRYFPEDFTPCYSLHDYLSDAFKMRSGTEMQRRFEAPPDEVLKALAIAAEHQVD